ncbi:MAG: hypothetical protein ACI3T9_07270 [Romboutsia timonensis]
MKTLTDVALSKMAQLYIDSLSHVLYKLDGEEKQIDFFSKKVVGRMAQAYVFFDENYKGTITNIRVIDKDGDIVAKDSKVYERTTDKALYVAFKHEFTEV